MRNQLLCELGTYNYKGYTRSISPMLLVTLNEDKRTNFESFDKLKKKKIV